MFKVNNYCSHARELCSTSLKRRKENNHIKKSAQIAFERSWWTLQYHPQRKEWDSESILHSFDFPSTWFASRHCRARFVAGDSHWQVPSRCCRTLIIIYFSISMVYWCAAFTIAFYSYLRIFLIFFSTPLLLGQTMFVSQWYEKV